MYKLRQIPQNTSVIKRTLRRKNMAKLLIFVSLALTIIFAFESNGAHAHFGSFAPFGILSKVHPGHPWHPSRFNPKEKEFHRQLRFVQPRVFSKPTEEQSTDEEVLISRISQGEARKMREYMILRKI